ncbi:MAG: epoxyqueuosine reductase QueH [Clostridiales bacterium]|nr:epoxyqueuosine reductase QueH [Clostridiales bacterium]
MKLLLHTCCGPCAMYPLELLISEGNEITTWFYNPNIHPVEEFEKRLENAYLAISSYNLPFLASHEMLQESWENFCGSNDERCTMCYSLRLGSTAKKAAKEGFEAFTTTLLVSPYQKHELIKTLGESLAKKYSIHFLYKDFRSGFRHGQQLAKASGLYRQRYCGCIVSLPLQKD